MAVLNSPELTRVLYHGSTVTVKAVNLHECIKERDFGCGFYTTTSRLQAERFAKTKAHREARKKGFVSEYLFVQNKSVNLNRKIFARPDFEWLDFVAANRMPERFRRVSTVTYDIIIGPMAIDAAGVILNNYVEGTYGDPESAPARTLAVNLIEASNPEKQIFFGTAVAVSCLQYKGVSFVGVDG